MRTLASLLIVVLLASCGEESGVELEGCNFVPLPVRGSANAPAVTDILVELQSGEFVNLLMTVVDPQGTPNLDDVRQTARVFTDDGCGGTPIEVRDEMGSGQEESFGIVFRASQNRPLYDAINAAIFWPVEVDLFDRDGNRTQGILRATVRH